MIACLGSDAQKYALFGKGPMDYFPEMIRRLDSAGALSRPCTDTTIYYSPAHIHSFHLVKRNENIRVRVSDDTQIELETKQTKSVLAVHTKSFWYKIVTCKRPIEYISIQTAKGDDMLHCKWDTVHEKVLSYQYKSSKHPDLKDIDAIVKNNRTMAMRAKITLPAKLR